MIILYIIKINKHKDHPYKQEKIKYNQKNQYIHNKQNQLKI